jgi:hypothetical protein
VDMKKAFDVCYLTILLKKIKVRYFRENIGLVQQLLKDRVQRADIGSNLSSEKVFNNSVIQRSILGLILFLIYTNYLHNCIKILTFMFTDDIACVASDMNLVNLVNLINTELTKQAGWFCEK